MVPILCALFTPMSVSLVVPVLEWLQWRGSGLALRCADSPNVLRSCHPVAEQIHGPVPMRPLVVRSLPPHLLRER